MECKCHGESGKESSMERDGFAKFRAVHEVGNEKKKSYIGGWNVWDFE